MNMNKKWEIKFSTTDLVWSNELIKKYQSLGKVVIHKYYKRRFFIFGKKKYVVIMGASEISIEEQINTAIKEENYELAAKLKQLNN